jgi:tRNA pseudouridine55 synthase
MNPYTSKSGILLLNKPKGKTSFHLVSILRRILNVQTIGHTGTLDPLATGVMVMLIGKQYTKLSNEFINHDKEYAARIHLGISTDSYDAEGKVLRTCPDIPSPEQIAKALTEFQGNVLQTPPMFSAKKQGGKKLYELARKGVEVERPACPVNLNTTLVNYCYPYLDLRVACSKGTYIRSIAHDLGEKLGTGAHLAELIRTRSGPFSIDACFEIESLAQLDFDWDKALIKSILP